MSMWKSPFGAKPIEDSVGGEAPASERERRWGGLLARLQEQEEPEEPSEREENGDGGPGGPPAADDADADGRPSNDAVGGGASVKYQNHGLVHSLYLQQLRGSANFNTSGRRRNDGGREGRSRASDAEEPPSSPAPPPSSSLPLRDWIAHHSARAGGGRTTTAFGLAGARRYCKGTDRGYLERAARVALSLAEKLEACYRGRESKAAVHREAIVADNVLVTRGGAETETEEAAFVDAISLSEDAPPPPTLPSQRSAICALGKIYYELFSQGATPSSADEDSIAAAAAASSVPEPSSFELALNIAEGDDGGGDARRRRRKQPRRASYGGDRNDHYAALGEAGAPPSLCRLVADMLENGDDDDGEGGEGDGGTTTGRLFRGDRAVATFSEAVCDLRQMVDDPGSFLHDALLFRVEPVVPDRLYGREDGFRRCSEAAEAFRRTRGGARSTAGTRPPRSAIMVSGFSGSGKSTLVKEVEELLKKKGWRCLYCKFNPEVRPQPLSTIASAFDRFLADLVVRVDPKAREEVKTSMAKVFQDAGIDVEAHPALFQLIPTLRKFLGGKEACSEPNKVSFNTQDAHAAKCRLHQLFGLLVRALSDHPLFLCMDDLQWADSASLELVNFLVEGIEEVNNEKKEREGPDCSFLLVGCFRSNEVSESHPLAACIQRMKSCRAVALEEIQLEGLKVEDVSALVSDSLFYPRRLTRSLSNLIHQKTAGNPLFVKEFLNSLATENLLTYSLSNHKWNFDEDLIQLKTVSEGVADLLTRRLQRLPEGVLSGLEVMSCFGSDVSLEVMLHVRNVCGNADIIAGLDRATKELLIKRNPNGSYTFVHDMIQQMVSRGIQKQRRVRMLKDIADALIASTEEERRDDAVLFVIVDLINRVGPGNTSDGKDRALYASFNLSAGEKSLKLPDIESAVAYLESGISFLDDGYWARHYSLSLALFKNASLAHWALGKTKHMKKRINELLDNAQCFEDKLDSMNVMIHAYAFSFNSGEKGLELCFDVLQKLGERFPKSLEDAHIIKELTDTNKQLQGLLPSSLDTLPLMEDKQKLQAMDFLGIACSICFQLKSRYLAILSSRLVRLTMAHGLSGYSAVGLSCMAMSVATLHDFSGAYRLGKLARSLNKSSKVIPKLEVDLTVLSIVNVWKEPIQSVLPPLLDTYKLAVRGGDMTTACYSALSYIARAFYSGSSLMSLAKETSVFLRLMLRSKRTFLYLMMVPFANAMTSLTGTNISRHEEIEGYEGDEKNLIYAFEKKEISLAETIVVKEMTTNFILRRMDAASRLVRQYTEFFECIETGQISMVQRLFYTGLIAFHFLRESQDSDWAGIGQNAIQKFEYWTGECKWNFQNKLLLLQAEYHFAIGELEAANDYYTLSIASANNHRFIHEEAIACELSSLFHASCGRKDLSDELLKRSATCYQMWGARGKVDALCLPNF